MKTATVNEVVAHWNTLDLTEYLRRLNLLGHTPETLHKNLIDCKHFEHVIYNSETGLFEEFQV